jgi:diguanylate cyclase (GGDEF)-like protein
MSVLEKGIEEKREGGMALIMIDIDHFKGINDTYGHTVGDEVIVKISGVLQDSVRKTDILGRIGGEEFMVVLNDVDQETACAIAEDLREKVMNIAWIRVREQVTISSGLYMVKESDSLNDALEAVDTRLYQAKDEGRNRVAV